MFQFVLTLLIVFIYLPNISEGACSAVYSQCGGQNWPGSTCCVDSVCTFSSAYYSQCLPGTTVSTTSSSTTQASTGCNALYSQCGGQNWSGSTCCVNSVCTFSSAYYSQCLAGATASMSSSASSTTQASNSAAKASSSTTSTAQASTSTTKVSSSTTQASTSTTKASTSTTKPSTSTTQASTSTTKPSTSTTQASTSTTKASTSTTKPSTSTTQASTSTTKASTSTTKPSTSTTQASTSTTKASTSTTKPSTSTTQASTSTTKASTSTTKPSTSTTQPTTSTTKASTSTTQASTSTTKPTTMNSVTQGCSAVYNQCGGTNWAGPTTCCSGSTCQYGNPYYSQCLPTAGASTSSSSPSTASTASTVSTASPASTASTSISVGTPGKTTRYWDCCKVSCAWPGKAFVNNPVQACAANGSPIPDSNTQSGCNGGTAYTCDNQQPWNVSSTLSYGYAAAYISGQGESNWCCACYLLTFTSTSIAGKQMIVQVINTGADLGSNQFDLQMPGGGMGIFSGCTSQFTGPYLWGAQYGGVSQRSDCTNLPTRLQRGCFWRFDWFQNADNPSMVFTPLTCPAAVTANTNCARQ